MERALDPAAEQEAIVRYLKGMTIERIAGLLQVHASSVRRALDRAGVDRRPAGFQQQYPDDVTATIVRMRDDEDATWQEIADTVGMRVGGVRWRYDAARRTGQAS